MGGDGFGVSRLLVLGPPARRCSRAPIISGTVKSLETLQLWQVTRMRHSSFGEQPSGLPPA